MSITLLVEGKLKADNGYDIELDKALADAERMAEEYADINPIPYIVPMEKYIGLSFERKNPK